MGELRVIVWGCSPKQCSSRHGAVAIEDGWAVCAKGHRWPVKRIWPVYADTGEPVKKHEKDEA